MSNETTPEKPPTMRAQVDNILKVVDDLARRQNEKPTNAAAAPRPVAEAVALQQCIRALDDLTESERNARSSTFNPNLWTSAGTVDRILRHLAAKYGVQLIQRETEPCNRPHLDTLDDTAIGYAIRQAVQQP